jgi:salicylate 5-hydroxylase large subunit
VLFRDDQKSATEDDQTGRHGSLISRRGQQEINDVTSTMRTFRGDIKLADPRILDAVKEYPDEDAIQIMTLFPSVVLQSNLNSMSTRHIVPTGPEGFDFHWTHWGYADDTPEMRQRRMRQSSLFGPAGLVSADDGEAIEMCQRGFAHSTGESALVVMSGRDTESVEHMVTEVAIRGMYRYWRETMGL